MAAQNLLYPELFAGDEYATLFGDEYRDVANKLVKDTQESLRTRVIDPIELTTSEKNPRHRKFPDFMRNTQVGAFDGMGRGIVSIAEDTTQGRQRTIPKNIAIGKRVLLAKPFATVLTPNNRRYCQSCHYATKLNLMCDGCGIVYWCSEKCKGSNVTHRLECQTIFQNIKGTDIDEKLIIQMVLETMAIFFTDNNNFDLERLMTTARNAYQHRTEVPAQCNSPESRFHAIMKLTPRNYAAAGEEARTKDRDIANKAYNFISTFPQVMRYFEGETTFLEHLIAHFASLIPSNSFAISLHIGNVACRRLMIYDNVSYLNHSCAPNIVNFVDGNEMIGFACQTINVGDQLTISYLGQDDLKRTRTHRRKELLKSHNFRCECDRCTIDNPDPVENRFVQAAKLSMAEHESRIRGLEASEAPIDQKIPFIWAYRSQICNVYEHL